MFARLKPIAFANSVAVIGPLFCIHSTRRCSERCPSFGLKGESIAVGSAPGRNGVSPLPILHAEQAVMRLLGSLLPPLVYASL